MPLPLPNGITAYRRRLAGVVRLGFVAALLIPILRAAPPPSAAVSFEHDVTPLLQNYCYDCHGDGKHKADLALDSYATVADVLAARKKWELVLQNVSRHVMPPDDGGPVPTAAERDIISRWIESVLFQLDPAHPDPGRVVLRRLNRAEYNATIRDLVGVDFKPADEFPPDDSGYGFDNIGDVLTLTPVLLEKYLNAADKVLDQAIVTDPIKSEVRHVPASLAEIGFNAIGDRGDGWVHLISLEEDDAAVEFALPAGDYLLRAMAYATPTGGAIVGQGSEKPLEFSGDPGPTRLAFLLNDTVVQSFELTHDEQHPGVYEARLGVPAGRQRFRAAVIRQRGGLENDTYMLNGRLGRQQPGIVFLKWLEVVGPLPAATRRVPADHLEVTGDGRFAAGGDRVFTGPGTASAPLNLSAATEVILRAEAYARQSGPEPARMEFLVDGQPVRTFDVAARARLDPLPQQRVFSLSLLEPAPQVYEFRTRLPAGAHRFAAAFVNPGNDPQNENPNLRERDLVVRDLEVTNLSEPVVIPGKPAPIAELFNQALTPAPVSGFARLFGRAPAPVPPEIAARKILAQFTRRAWRRPVAADEIDRLMGLYTLAREQGDSFDAGVKLAMKGVLASPHFLLLGEPRPAAVATAGPHPLDEISLASRLSYFLWSSLPDDELLGLAERGQLRANLAAQVRRMIASPKSRALVENFAGQWLQIRSLGTFEPDRKLFPDFDPLLRTAMQRETELFFEHVMRADCSVFDFLDGDYTFVNGRLARLYGLPGVTGEEFRQVSLAGTPRRGVLTQASILTLTSNPTRTSPVKRGKWVLENLLASAPPPPPPNIPALDDHTRQLTGTLRQQMEQHRTNATCISCHARMDPIGFSLENFNAIGAWRDKDGDNPIDATGEMPGGDKFAGAAGLAELLSHRERWEFLHCLADRALTYSLGRGTDYYDRPALDQIVQSVEQDGDRFTALILAVVQSFPFQNVRGDAPVDPKDAAPARRTAAAPPPAGTDSL